MIRPTGLPSVHLPTPSSGFKASEIGPSDRIELQGGEPLRASVEVAPAQTAERAALGALPPLASLPLAERMGKLPVEFMVKRRFRLWFMDTHQRVTPEKAAGQLGNNPRLSVRLDSEEPPQPLPDKKAFVALEALHGEGSTHELDKPLLAEQLKKLASRPGVTFTRDGFPLNTFGAYNALSGEDESAVLLRTHQLPVVRLKPGVQDLQALQTLLESAEQKVGDPLATAEYLTNLYPRQRATVAAELARHEKGPDAPVYALLRGAVERGGFERLKEGLECVKQGTLQDRLQLLADSNHGENPYYVDHRAMGAAHDHLVEAGISPADARQACLKVLGRWSHDRESFEALKALAPATGGQMALFGRLTEISGPGPAAEAARAMAAPAGQLTESERIGLFEKLPQSVSSRTQAWALLQADLEQGRSLAEATERVKKLLAATGPHDHSAPAAHHAAAHPERLESVCQLVSAGCPGKDVGPILDSIHACGPEFVELAGALGGKARRVGLPFAQAAHKHPGSPRALVDELKPLAVMCSRQEDRVIRAIAEDWRPDPVRTKVTTSLVEARLGEKTVPLLHSLESWPGTTPLEQRWAAMVAVGAGADDGYSLIASQPGGREATSKAFAALLGAGQTSKAAGERIAAALQVGQRSYHREDSLKALEFLAEQAANPGALDLFGKVYTATHNVDIGSDCARQLMEPAGSSTQEQRIAAALELGLPASQAHASLLAALKTELEAGLSAQQAVANLAPLVEKGRAWEGGEKVLMSFLSEHREERTRLLQLAQAGFPPNVATATLSKLQGGRLQELLPLGQAGRALRKQAVEAFAALDGSNAAALARLCTAHGKRPLDRVDTLTAHYCGQSEETELLARLIEESPFSAPALAELYPILQAPAGSTTMAERLDAFKKSRGFATDYGTPGYNTTLATRQASALCEQLRGGVPPAEACATLDKIWATARSSYHWEEDMGQALGFVAELGGAHERRDFFVSLLSAARMGAAHARHGEELVHQPLGGTSYADRVTAFRQLALEGASEPKRNAIFGAYRAEVEAARGPERLLPLSQALVNQPDSEVAAAFDFVAATRPGNAELKALHDQLAAGVKPSVAVAALKSASDDLSRLDALKGLGKAGRRLEAKVAEAFLRQQQEALGRGVERATVDATMSRISGAVGAVSLSSEQRIAAAEHWGQNLADRPEATEVFARMLEQGATVETGKSLLAILDQPAGSTTLTARLEAFTELGGFSQEYGRPGYDVAHAHWFCRALTAPLAHGVGLELARKDVATLWGASRSYYGKDELQGLFEQYAKVAPSADQRGFLVGLVQAGWRHQDALFTSQEMSRPLGEAAFVERKRAFDGLGLRPETDSGLKQQALRSLREEVEAGVELGAAATDLQRFVTTDQASRARSILQHYTGSLQGRGPERVRFVELTDAGLSPDLSSQVVLAAGDNLAAHARLIKELAPYGSRLELKTAQAFTRALDRHGEPGALGALARAVASRQLSAAEPLEYYSRQLVGKPDSHELYLKLLDALPSSASQAHAALEATGGDPAERFEALKAAGCYEVAARNEMNWLADVHQEVLHAADGAGVPREEALKIVKGNFGHTGWQLSNTRPLYDCLLKTPGEMVRWASLLEELGPRYGPAAHAALSGLGPGLLDLYPVFRQAELAPQDAANLLQHMVEHQSGTTLEQRGQAYEKMSRVSSQDGRTFGRKAWSALASLDDVSTGQLPTLVLIYDKLVGLGQSSERAVDLVCGIYAAEQAKGVPRKELASRLDQIAEVAKLDIRPDTGVAILKDDADRVVFSGVTIKKRKAPTLS